MYVDKDGKHADDDATSIDDDGTRITHNGTRIASDGTRIVSDGTSVFSNETRIDTLSHVNRIRTLHVSPATLHVTYATLDTSNVIVILDAETVVTGDDDRHAICFALEYFTLLSGCSSVRNDVMFCSIPCFAHVVCLHSLLYLLVCTL